MTAILRVARNVGDLAASTQFYNALGFSPSGEPLRDAALAALLGVEHTASQRLQIGAQQLELVQCTPPGAAYPEALAANDCRFQHIAIVTRDIFAAHANALRAGAREISRGGPQLLPEGAAGVTAWKFRDPDGHPLEFLQIPGATDAQGYDHSAIAVADAARSMRFYEELGFELRHRHLNHGREQDFLDGLALSIVEVVSMSAADAPPHLELLAYRDAVAGTAMRPNDIAADRLVFAGTAPELRQDPDGHFLLFET